MQTYGNRVRPHRTEDFFAKIFLNLFIFWALQNMVYSLFYNLKTQCIIWTPGQTLPNFDKYRQPSTSQQFTLYICPDIFNQKL